MYEFEYNFERKLAVEGEKVFEEYWEDVCVPEIKQAIAINPDAIFAVYQIDHSAAMRAIYSLLPRGIERGPKTTCFHSVDEYMNAQKELFEHFMECLKDAIGYYSIRKQAAALATHNLLSDSAERIKRNNKQKFYAKSRNLVHELWLNR